MEFGGESWVQMIGPYSGGNIRWKGFRMRNVREITRRELGPVGTVKRSPVKL